MSGIKRDEWHEIWKAQEARKAAAIKAAPIAPIPVLTEAVKAGKPSKYHNQKTNGYASLKEAKRAFQLKLMQEAGAIQDLEEQKVYLLIPAQYVNGKCVERACTYKADFVYRERLSGRLVVQDVKGMRTEVYNLKRKLMLFVHKIQISEV